MNGSTQEVNSVWSVCSLMTAQGSITIYPKVELECNPCKSLNSMLFRDEDRWQSRFSKELHKWTKLQWLYVHLFVFGTKLFV
jgi:hypothetical protein